MDTERRQTAIKLLVGFALLGAALVSGAVAIYLYAVYQLVSSCLGGGTNTCHHDNTILVYLVIALVCCAAGVVTAIFLLTRSSREVRTQVVRSIPSGDAPDEV